MIILIIIVSLILIGLFWRQILKGGFISLIVLLILSIVLFFFLNKYANAEDLIYENFSCAAGYIVSARGTQEEFKNDDWYEYRIYKDGNILGDYFKDDKQCRVFYSPSRGNLISEIFCNGVDEEATSTWNYQKGFNQLINIDLFFDSNVSELDFTPDAASEEQLNSIGMYSCAGVIDSSNEPHEFDQKNAEELLDVFRSGEEGSKQVGSYLKSIGLEIIKQQSNSTICIPENVVLNEFDYFALYLVMYDRHKDEFNKNFNDSKYFTHSDILSSAILNTYPCE